MTTADIGAEREIDLSGWRSSLVERWWFVAAGLVAGIVIGAIYGLSGGTTYQASVLIAPGQPFSPNGSPVLTYQSSPLGIHALATSASVIAEAAQAAGVTPHALNGHVAVQTVSTGASASNATRGANLIQVTVNLPKRKAAEAAADKLGQIIITSTTSKYVRSSIASYQTKLASLNENLKATQSRLASYNAALKNQPNLAFIDRLFLTINISNNQQLLSTIQDAISGSQQQLTLAQNIEQAQLIGPQNATAVKTTARSRRNSIVFGALIGLIIGAIVAIVAGVRAARPRGA
jgi:uncharacterized protein involved in exopolysaccharide biosynthesis